MDQEVNEKSKKRRLKLYYGLLISIVCIIGVSFAWFRLYLSQSENNTLASRTCFSTTLTEDTSKIALTDAFPISDADGLKQTPFTFTLKNNCDSYVKVYITIDSTYRESTNTGYLKDSYMKVNVSPKDTTSGASKILGSQTLTDLENDRKGYIIVSTGLSANEEKSYDLRVWMDGETTLEQGLNKNWAGKIVVVSNAAVEKPTLGEAILASNEVQTPLTTPGKSASSATEALLASTEDDYGTSYYFRGAVKNNYVQFANKCWRIVRIVGDGSVKLVLHNDNTSGMSNPCSSSNNSNAAAFAHYDGTTYESAFNNISSNDNAYVEFMYGTVGASDYASTHANINKSTILTNLETWYKNNLISYEDKLADTIWCNDKSTINDGLGYGSNNTDYASVRRMSLNTTLSSAPTLICPNDNNGGKLSKFTVDDTTYGNGDLTYRIGLLTADEVAFAGIIFSYSENDVYLKENIYGDFWTMSPALFADDGTICYTVFKYNLIIDKYVQNSSGLRPAISLVSDIEISGGTGTSEDPYIID